MIRCGAGICSHPQINLRLMRGSEHIYPVSLILLYFACQYTINGCFSPKLLKAKRVVGQGGLKRLDVSVFFDNLFPYLVVSYISAQDNFSSACRLLNQVRYFERRMELQDIPPAWITFLKDARIPQQKQQFRFVCHQNNCKPHIFNLTFGIMVYSSLLELLSHDSCCLINKKKNFSALASNILVRGLNWPDPGFFTLLH